MDKPIGISEYELTRALPANLKSVLPTVEEIEAELAESATERVANPKVKKAMAVKKKAKPAKKPRNK